MKRWQRNTLAGVAALAVLLLLALVAAHILVDPEKLKTLAREKAEAAWSRELSLGAIELGFFPVPRIEARDVAFANPPWASEPQFFRAERVEAHLALLPLLSGDVKLKSLEIAGARVVLETSKDGLGTWQLAGPKEKAAAPKHPPRDNLLELRRVRVENLAVVDRRKRDAPHLWHVREARLLMVPVLRDLRFEAELARDGRPLRIAAKLDDGSRFNEAGATSPGRIEMDWAGAKLVVAGTVPLHASLQGQRLHGDLTAPALGDMLGFFGHDRQPRVPIEAHFDSTAEDGVIRLRDIVATMGGVRATGTADLRLGATKSVYDLRLSAGDVDWSKALEDAGGKVQKGVPEGEILPDTPMGWGILRALRGKKGTLEAQVANVKLGNGLALHNVKTKMSFDEDRLDIQSFTTDTLGGSASFKGRMEGGAQRGHLDMEGRDLLLEQWFRERGKKIPFKGGPMQIKASLDSKGESMKDLAANMSGPVTIRMGRGVYASEKAGEVESTLASASGSQEGGIRFDCVAANLPFRSGRAEKNPLVGAASEASLLLTSGVIDFRAQKLELHGRLRPRAGVALATVVGDVRIFGPMAKPGISLDHPSALARIGAAIATAGLSAAATALVDATTVKTDNPCEEVFVKR
jgi:uncharacterized protein involved in outer membrane biogenesis